MNFTLLQNFRHTEVGDDFQYIQQIYGRNTKKFTKHLYCSFAHVQEVEDWIKSINKMIKTARSKGQGKC